MVRTDTLFTVSKISENAMLFQGDATLARHWHSLIYIRASEEPYSRPESYSWRRRNERILVSSLADIFMCTIEVILQHPMFAEESHPGQNIDFRTFLKAKRGADRVAKTLVPCLLYSRC